MSLIKKFEWPFCVASKLVACSSFALASCSTDLSYRAPYRKQIGPVTLKEPIVAVDTAGFSYAPLTRCELVEPKYAHLYPGVFRELSVGSRLVLKSVSWISAMDNAFVDAVLEILSTPASQKFECEYHWTASSSGQALYIKRAPWENSDEVPIQRYVGWQSKRYGSSPELD